MCFVGTMAKPKTCLQLRTDCSFTRQVQSENLSKSMGTSCSKCECNYSETEETVNAIRGHLEETLSGMSHGFHLDTVWKTVLAIGTVEVLLLIGHKLYRVTHTHTKKPSSTIRVGDLV